MAAFTFETVSVPSAKKPGKKEKKIIRKPQGNAISDSKKRCPDWLLLNANIIQILPRKGTRFASVTN